MRTVLVMILFLSMVLGMRSVTTGKELPVIHTGYAGTVPVREGILKDVYRISEDAANLAGHEKRTELAIITPDELVYEKTLIPENGLDQNWDPAGTSGFLPETFTAKSVLDSGKAYLVSDDLGSTDTPPFSGAADAPEISVSGNEMAGISGEDSSSYSIPVTENNGSDIPAADITVLEENSHGALGSDCSVSDGTDNGSTVEDSTVKENADSGTEENADANAGVSGFIVDESGMIRGISDMSLAVSDMCLFLPAEGCTGIASNAFVGMTEEIVDVYIPSNITNIEEGAFLGLPYVCKYEVEAGNSMYLAQNGVLFSEGGSCLFAFPSGRTGTYFVPEGVTRFACDAFTGSMLSKLDTRSCALEDIGNLPENITVQ